MRTRMSWQVLLTRALLRPSESARSKLSINVGRHVRGNLALTGILGIAFPQHQVCPECASFRRMIGVVDHLVCLGEPFGRWPDLLPSGSGSHNSSESRRGGSSGASMVLTSLIDTTHVDPLKFLSLSSLCHQRFCSSFPSQTAPNSNQFLTQRASAMKLPSIAFSRLPWKTRHFLSR